MKLKPFVQKFFAEPDDSQVGTGQQQTQQQQTQEVETPDPFKDVDLDLLDDATREAVKKAQDQLKQVPVVLKQARQFQSGYDKAMAELQKLQQQQQEPTKTTAEPTFEDEIVEEYIREGIPAEQAKRAAKILNNTLGKFAKRTAGFVDSRIEPLANSVAMQEASSNFTQVRTLDQRLQIPEVAEKVWERTAAQAKAGNVMTPDMIVNMAKVFYVDYLEAGGNQTQQQQQQQAAPMQTQQTTRFSFPGAGNIQQNQIRKQVSTVSDLDAETAAAIATTAKIMREFLPGMKKKQGK